MKLTVKASEICFSSNAVAANLSWLTKGNPRAQKCCSLMADWPQNAPPHISGSRVFYCPHLLPRRDPARPLSWSALVILKTLLF